MSETHARFSPSKLPRLLSCSGSLSLCEALEKEQPFCVEQSSQYADEGSYLHSVTADHLTRSDYHVSSILHEDGDKHIEYKAAVEDVLDWVFSLKNNNQDEDSVEGIENRVSLKRFSGVFNCGLLEEVEGTTDFTYEANRNLWVADWKFGKGVVVEPDTEQLKAYATGKLKSVANSRKYDKVFCVVGQPRIDNDQFKIIEYTPDDLLWWTQHVLSPGLLRTQAEYPVFTPSEKNCRWCPAKMICKARHAAAMTAAEKVFAAHLNMSSGTVSLEELSVVLDMLPQLDAYTKDLATYAFDTLVKGGSIPNYKIVRGRSIRKWATTDERLIAAQLETLGLDIEDYTKIKFRSPTQIEKTLPKTLRKDPTFTDLVVKPQGKLTLATLSDKREAVSGISAEEAFAAFSEENDDD